MNHQKVTPSQGIELTDIDGDNKLDDKLITIKPGETPFQDSDTAPAAAPNTQRKIIPHIINKYKRLIIFLLVLVILFLFGLIIYKMLSFSKVTTVGIYFGSANSGYYIIKDSNKSLTYSNINYSDLILAESGLYGLKYGFEAHNYPKKDLKTEKKLYFSNFKKYLIQNESIDKVIISSDFPEKINVNLDRIIKQYLNLLKDNIKENKNLKTKNLKWVLTIPDLWGEKNKEILKDIAEDIDIYNIKTISESNATLMGLLNDDKFKDYFNQKKVIMIINFDRFSTDINIYQIKGTKNFKQLACSINYSNGSNLINEEIINIMKAVYTEKEINKVKNDFDIWKISLDDIEKKIKTVDVDSKDLEIRADFTNNYKKFIVQRIYDFKGDYKGFEIPYYKGKMMIPSQLAKKIVNETISNTLNKVEDLINNFNEKINSIFILGDFSKSKLFQNEIFKKFNNEILLFFLQDYEKLIVKGAAFYGLN